MVEVTVTVELDVLFFSFQVRKKVCTLKKKKKEEHIGATLVCPVHLDFTFPAKM